jgi:hypothetical protein
METNNHTHTEVHTPDNHQHHKSLIFDKHMLENRRRFDGDFIFPTPIVLNQINVNPELQPQSDGSYMLVFSGSAHAIITPIPETKYFFVALYKPMTGGPFQYISSSKEAAKDLSEAKEIAGELFDNDLERKQKISGTPSIEQATAILSNNIFGINGIHGMGTVYLPGKEPYIEIQVLEPYSFDFVKNLIPTSTFMSYPVNPVITPQSKILPSTSYIHGRSSSAIAEGDRTIKMTLGVAALFATIIILGTVK